MKLFHLISFFLSFFDKILIKYNKSFSQLAKLKLILYKRFFQKPPEINFFSTKPIYKDIIISLTTMNSRINFVRYTLNSLLHQNYRVYKIIVNYDRSINIKKIKKLKKIYKKFNVEFRLVKNFFSHKKYLFLNKREINFRILLCDDDMIYDKWFLQDMVILSNHYPKCVVTLFGWEIEYGKNGEILARDQWKFKFTKCHSSKISYWSDNAYSLFPKNFFDKNIMSKTKVKKYFTNLDNNIIGYDDSWINFNRIKKKIKVFYVRPYSKLWLPAEKMNTEDSLGNRCKGFWYEGEVFKRLNNLKLNK